MSIVEYGYSHPFACVRSYGKAASRPEYRETVRRRAAGDPRTSHNPVGPSLLRLLHSHALQFVSLPNVLVGAWFEPGNP